MKIGAITKLTQKLMNSRRIANIALKFQKHWPEISLVLGIGASVGSTATAIVQTTKLEPILDWHEKKMTDIRQMEPGDKKNKETLKTYVITLKNIAKLYAVPAALEISSAALQISGHHTLRKENARILAAYIGVSEAYKRVCERIKQQEGTQKYLEYMADEVVETEKTNEEGEVVKEKYVVMNNDLSMYARLFDSTNKNWERNPILRMQFLKTAMLDANRILHERGFIFLNEVYDLLGFDRSEAGQFVGWVDGMGDNVVDFGIFNVMNKNAVEEFEEAYWLDFNVDGAIMYIFDKLHDGDGKNANYMVCK